MARVFVILAVILSLFVLSHARLSTEPTAAAAAAAAATTSSETSTDADREPSETLDPTVHFVQSVPINEIGDGSLPTDDIFRHIEFSLRRPIYHHRHHFRHFRDHRRHRMRAMEIALGADAIGLPGDRFPLRSSEEKGLVKEGEAEEIKREKPMEEEEIEKREDDSDSDSDDDEEDKVEKMEKRKRKGDCKKNKKHHHLHRFLRHRHHRHEQDEAEKIGFMKRFWDFLNHY